MHSNRSQIEFPKTRVMKNIFLKSRIYFATGLLREGDSEDRLEDQAAGVRVLAVLRSRQSALDTHQLAAQLPEQPRDVPVVLGAHLHVVQFPGLFHLTGANESDGDCGSLTDLVADVLSQLASLLGVRVGEKVHLVGHHHHGNVRQAS